MRRQKIILLVEDDLGDIDLIREAMKQAEAVTALEVVPDGVQAIEYLRRVGPYAGAVRPDVILLDLNLPKKDGREVLREIKGDPDLRSIPVITFSTSSAESDIRASYRLGANCYISKPLGLNQFVNAIRAIQHFWFTVAQLPPR